MSLKIILTTCYPELELNRRFDKTNTHLISTKIVNLVV